MIFHKLSTVLIWSENANKLADWYQNTFNLRVVQELNHPQDTGVLFEFPGGDTWLWIGQHSEVHGKNPDPHRHMFNLNVDSVQKAYEYLIDKGVEFFAKPFKAPTMEKYFATFYDPDGNFIQIIGPR
jgi:catechol 2,3-dioxygenase-like lactoylglutathione lyase family enzyme